MMFAVITPLLITGAFAERLKWSSFFIFIIAWSFLVYYPLAHWIWGRGWLADLGVYDFAGGIVIHTSAGLASIAALILGRRRNFGPDIMVPHNIPLAYWVPACFGLDGLGLMQEVPWLLGVLRPNTLLVTQIASVTSAMVWLFLSWRRAGKPSTTAVINGAISGLAGVTPASWLYHRSEFVLVGYCARFCVLLWNITN